MFINYEEENDVDQELINRLNKYATPSKEKKIKKGEIMIDSIKAKSLKIFLLILALGFIIFICGYWIFKVPVSIDYHRMNVSQIISMLQISGSNGHIFDLHSMTHYLNKVYKDLDPSIQALIPNFKVFRDLVNTCVAGIIIMALSVPIALVHYFKNKKYYTSIKK